MASITEIRARIKSVEETVKITNAMYLISSSKMKKARRQHANVRPYFEKISSTIADILKHSPDLDHVYFNRRSRPGGLRIGYVVISGDKGLAGAYNHNILKLAEEQLKQTPNARLFVIGQVGRQYFLHKHISVDAEFTYVAQDPTMYRAREISELLVDLFLKEELDEISVIYTHMVSAFQMEPCIQRLLPLSPEDVRDLDEPDAAYHEVLSYVPSANAVLNNLVPAYVKGMLFGALVEAFCSEQNARMTAMDSATKNARELISSLSLAFNRARQAAITQEITEIVGGAEGLK